MRCASLLTLAAASILAIQPLAAQADLPREHGIDVSHYSGEIDWERVSAAGYSFVYVKATEGVDSADPLFLEHWQTLGELGIPRGAYHFYVTEDDPKEQARFFLGHVEHRPGDLPPVVDVEVLGHGTKPGLPGRLRRFLELVELELGVTPIIYTSPSFWNAHLDPSFGCYPLWLAEYGTSEPQLPHGWTSWLMWQFEADAEVPGIEKGADLSTLHPDADLLALAF